MMDEKTLTEILEGYAFETPAGNDQKILQKWMERYPFFAEDLMDFAAARAVAKFSPEPEISAEEEARYREKALRNLRAFLGKSTHQSALESLTDKAKEKGMNRAKFAAALGLSVSLVQYLEKRRLDFASIPKAVIKKIADALETSEELVAGYLNRPPVSAVNASFKAQERPEEMKPKSFADAVREDQTLSSEEKQKLLEL
jgi:transcriptional regulator with XRE-family HTH domain